MPPELSRNESEMEGIRENYAIVARLHHSAISGLRQLEKDSEFGEYYLVMDIAKGEDLSTILRRRRGVPMPLDDALAILRPLASALDYAHGEHVLHRDVKPANVKVDGSRVQLLDFGLAAEVRSSMSRVSLRGHAGSSGTPAYMAPEQWEARRQSAATDQYSLAVMAYEMLSGYRLFDTDNMELLKSAVLTRAPDKIEGLPSYVNAALQKALAKNPKERFASCAEFVDCLAHGFFNTKPQRTQSQEDGKADLRVGHDALGGARFVAAETTHDGREDARSSPASANPWTTLGIELRVGAFVILLTVLCLWIQAQHLIQLPPSAAKPYLHLGWNPFFNALGWVVFIPSLVVAWRRLLRERCLMLCGYRIGWRIAVLILALVIVRCQLLIGLCAILSFMREVEYYRQVPVSVLFWPILTLVYPLGDVVLTHWRCDKKAL